MNRPIANSIQQIQRKGDPPNYFRYACYILKVNYVSRRIKVSAHGYSGPKKVAVQHGINLGTADNPIVTAGNVATIERQSDGRWLCISIKRKLLCATNTGIDSEVEVDNQFEPFFSELTDGFGSGIQSSDLFLPPIESLGQLSLAVDRFPGETSFLCGLPPCADCGDGLPGQVPVIQNEGCWKWDFRGASCGLYFRSQEAYYDYAPITDTRTLDQVVAVRENYAYIATVRFGPFVPAVSGGTTYNAAHLLTYDITDPTFPIPVKDQVIPTPLGHGLFDLGIAVKEDVLWVGAEAKSLNFVDGLTNERQITRFDISDRADPTVVSTWLTRLSNNFVPYLHFDIGTQTFIGDPYLVGFNWDYTDASLCQTELIVEDGLVGGEVQTLSGYTFGRYAPNDIFDLLATCPALVCDNTVLVRFWIGDPITVATDNKLLAVDLTNIPAGAIGVLWEDTNVRQPRVYLGGNHAYVIEQEPSFGELDRLYSQVNIDATYTEIGDTLPGDNESVQSWGYYLNGTCLLRGGNFNFPNGWSANILDQEVPILRSQAGAHILGTGGNGGGRDSDADQGATRVYLAHVQGGGQFAYLTIYSSP